MPKNQKSISRKTTTSAAPRVSTPDTSGMIRAVMKSCTLKPPQMHTAENRKKTTAVGTRAANELETASGTCGGILTVRWCCTQRR